MSCCGARLDAMNNPKTWIYTSPSGATTEYRSEIEAKAAKIRNGGGSIEAVRK